MPETAIALSPVGVTVPVSLPSAARVMRPVNSLPPFRSDDDTSSPFASSACMSAAVSGFRSCAGVEVLTRTQANASNAERRISCLLSSIEEKVDAEPHDLILTAARERDTGKRGRVEDAAGVEMEVLQ